MREGQRLGGIGGGNSSINIKRPHHNSNLNGGNITFEHAQMSTNARALNTDNLIIAEPITCHTTQRTTKKMEKQQRPPTAAMA